MTIRASSKSGVVHVAIPELRSKEPYVAIEQTCTQMVPKPWGSTDLRPWNAHHNDGAAIGEIWFRRAEAQIHSPALRLKLLFTNEPLSIQVHPDDAFARSIGLAHGLKGLVAYVGSEPIPSMLRSLDGHGAWLAGRDRERTPLQSKAPAVSAAVQAQA